MQISEIITLLKSKITPSLLRTIIEYTKLHTIFIAGTIIIVQGMVSGNVRITVSRRSRVEEYFILNYFHFSEHPLKVNQWR